MVGGDEIIFVGAYKDFRLGVRFDLTNKTPEYVAGALAYISMHIEPAAFAFSGIDTVAIEKLAALTGTGVEAVAAFLESKPPADLRAKLMATVPMPELYPAAESCFINYLLTKAGVAFKVAPPDSLKPAEEKIEDFIGFIGKYGNWVAIKKLGVDNAQDYEVSGILSSINHTAVNKAFDFIGWKTDVDAASEVQKRKSFSSLAQSLRELKGRLKGTPEDAFSVCARLERLGYRPYASPDMLTEAYPDIKPPKIRGRKPKG